MYHALLRETRTKQQVTDVFLGLQRKLKLREGEFYDTENLTSDHYPMLASRQPRQSVEQFTTGRGVALLAKDKLAWVLEPPTSTGSATLYYNGEAVTGLSLSRGEKRLVSMGAYLCIFPDKVYFNTADPSDYGSMEAHFSMQSASAVTYLPCRRDGSSYASVQTSGNVPENPSNGMVWIDTSVSPQVMRIYNAASGEWLVEAQPYVRIGCTGIGADFDVMDGVSISGTLDASLDSGGAAPFCGEHIIYARDDNYIVIAGLSSAAKNPENQTYTRQLATLKVDREVPDMDFVVECRNRLWGCFSGERDGKQINELYASALGSFKNWSQFLGVASDAWRASIGSDGAFTGAVSFGGMPLFWKAGRLHRVYVSPTGAHQVTETVCPGVQDGASASLAVVGSTLFYLSYDGVMAYDGSLPVCVSEALGTAHFRDAVGGAFGQKYYLCMSDSPAMRAPHSGVWALYVYDTEHALWHKESSARAVGFARLADRFYMLTASELLCLSGGTPDEDAVAWSATTGLCGYRAVGRKYVSRFNLRMLLPRGSDMEVELEYDSSGVWERQGHITGSGTCSFLLPVRPRRCDHFRIRLRGHGEMRLFSLAKIYEEGSDV